jgi:hypothetical protein
MKHLVTFDTASTEGSHSAYAIVLPPSLNNSAAAFSDAGTAENINVIEYNSACPGMLIETDNGPPEWVPGITLCSLIGGDILLSQHQI